MSDTLQTIIKSVQQTPFDGIDLLSKVDAFYNSAWDKLIIVGGLIFGVFGLIIPIIFQSEQKKLLKLKEKEILINTQEQLNKLKTELRDELKKEFENELVKLEEKIKSKSSALHGMALHLQGNSSIKDGKIDLAAIDFFKSISSYFVGEDYINFKVVCENIHKNCYPKMTKKMLDSIFHKQGISKEEYFENFKKHKNFNFVKKEINDLKFYADNLEDTLPGKH